MKLQFYSMEEMASKYRRLKKHGYHIEHDFFFFEKNIEHDINMIKTYSKHMNIT